MVGQDVFLRRERSMKHREFGLYATRMPAPPKPASASETPDPSPGAHTAYWNATDSHAVASDGPPQIPPIPVSPRWDSLSNSANIIFHQAAATSFLTSSGRNRDYSDTQVPAVAVESRLPGTAIGKSPVTLAVSPTTPASGLLPTQPDCGSNVTTAGSQPQPQRHDHSSHHATTTLPAIDTRQTTPGMSIENFSRPRKASVKSPTPEGNKQWHLAFHRRDHSFDETSYHYWPRARPKSIASTKSYSTVASIPQPSADYLESKIARPKVAATTLVMRPPIASSRIESTSSSTYTRDGAPWLPAGESRSSFRSLTTASSTHITAMTEGRSSVWTKDSSITSMYANMEEPSLEDVMGLYEKGFSDDSDSEVVEDVRPSASGISRQETSRREASPLATTIDHVPIPNIPRSISDDLSVPESPTIYETRTLAASVPKDMGTVGLRRRSTENRDSAKSLGDDGASLGVMHRGASRPVSQTSSMEDPDSRDRYGFRKQNQYITREQYDQWNKGYTDYLDRRRTKWVAFMKDSGLMTEGPTRFPQQNAKTKRFIRKGLPPEWRGAAWFYYAGGPAIMAKHAGVYDELLQKTPKEIDADAIERDLHRTFPDNLRFRPSDDAGFARTTEGDSTACKETEIISALRRVLVAFSIHNPKTGYCQSLNFLAGLLLLFVDSEEHCFWLLNVITRVYLPGTHETSLEGSRIDLGVLMESLQEAMPEVFTKIASELDNDGLSRPATAKSIKKTRPKKKDRKGSPGDRLPPITLCMTSWFMSCFIGVLPIETTLRVWDIFFYEGSKTLFRIAMAIFKLGEDEIRAVEDPMEMFSVVQTLPRRMLDANELMEACFKRRNGFGHISQQTIDSKRQEARETNELERRRQAAKEVALDGSVTEAEVEIRRKGTLFGRRKKGIDTARPAEMI